MNVRNRRVAPLAHQGLRECLVREALPRKTSPPGASPCHGASGAVAVPLHQVERDAKPPSEEAKQGEPRCG